MTSRSLILSSAVTDLPLISAIACVISDNVYFSICLKFDLDYGLDFLHPPFKISAFLYLLEPYIVQVMVIYL